MRFEIGKGGAVLILGGLLGLSGAVFALGLIAGQEITHQNEEDSAQVATVMVAPSPPLAAPTPSTSVNEASIASPPAPHSASTSAAAIAPRPVPPKVVQAAAPIAKPITPSRKVETASRVPAPSADSDTDEASADSSDTPPPTYKHPYNIQIEAVMDKDGADAMVRRFEALGYHSSEVATEVNGSTWYRVRVGPYDSAEEAKAAEERLHTQYKAAYSTR